MSGNSNALFIYLFIQMQEVRRKEEAAARGKLHFLYLFCYKNDSVVYLAIYPFLISTVYIAITVRGGFFFRRHSIE
jgi:hypothetical protein